MSQGGPTSSSGSGGSGVNTLTGNSGGAVSPSAGNINVVGSGGVSVVGNPSTHTLTISSSGGSSALTLIQTQTANNVTSLAFTTGLIYNNYLLQATNINLPVSMTSPNFVMNISTDGGSTYDPSALGLFGFNSNAAVVSCDCNIYNLTSGTQYILTQTFSVYYDPSVPFLGGTSVTSGFTTISTAANAFQLITDDSSNFSGVFSLYGYTT